MMPRDLDLHDTVIKAVREAVSDAGQPQKVADRLLIWMNAVARGESSLDEPKEVSERLEVVFGAMTTDKQ